MRTILVVHSVEARSARVWVCVTGVDGTPPPVTVRLSNGAAGTVGSDTWNPVTAGDVIPRREVRTFFQVVRFTGLPSGAAMIASANEAQARFSTLPAALPRVGQRPLSVLLGSCYYEKGDGGVASLVQAITREVRPDLKFLCGDQVYLDFPSFLLGIPFDKNRQARLFLAKYLRNWAEPGGLNSVLREGATWFCADDHEYWNNFPNPATIIAATWTSAGRRRYRRIAGSLYDTFQKDLSGDEPCRVFRIPPLEFMVVDTRSGRQRGDRRFMSSRGLGRVIAWIDGLEGPGVLVTAQPLFVEPQTGVMGGFRRRFFDRNLADYQQYDELAQSLVSAPHSILVLSGDVHFPRLARAKQPLDGRRGLYEVIASPSALVFGGHSRTQDTPGYFPAKPGARRRLPVRTWRASRYAGDNLATLDFTRVSGQVRVRLRYWYVETKRPGPSMEFVLI